MVSYREWAPPEDLRNIVKCFWHMDKTYGAGEDAGETVWPDGRVEVLFTFGSRYRNASDGNRELSDCLVIGPLTRPVRLESEGWLKLYGVRLQAWGFARLFRDPMFRLKDQMLPLSRFMGDEADKLRGQLEDLSPPEAVDRLTEWVRQQAGEHSELQDDVIPVLASHLEKPAGGLTIQEWAESSGWSARQLERIFKEEIGISPKQLWQIYRFNEARQTMLFHPETNLMEVAYRCGYYDYPHFSKAFVRYFQMTPKAFQHWVRRGRDKRLTDSEDVVFLQEFEPADGT